MLRAMRSFLKENDMMAYLTMMAVRLIELRRVLKPNGSIYLHCDPTASHYLKILLDAIFDARGYRSEISWKRSSAHNDAKQGRVQYGNVRDVILFYTKGKSWTWNWQFTDYDQSYVQSAYRFVDADGRKFRRDNLTAAKPGGDVEYLWPVKRPIGGSWQADLSDEFKHPKNDWEYKQVPPYRGRYWAYSKANMTEFAKTDRLAYSSSGMAEYKRYLDEMPGVPLQNDWSDIAPASGNEDLGYPTQKPVALLERIIVASSNEGDVILDPFCGCGTTIHGAEKLKRQWIGIDVTHLAISLIEKRLRDAFPAIQFDVHGTPKDLDGARELAAQDKYQFQWWAVSLINAVPYGGKKKGADSGIDGFVYFKPDGKTTEKAVVSVKGGENVSVAMIRDMGHVVDREKAKIGIFITLAEATGPMKTEAVKAGFYETPHHGKVAKLQIFTIADLFEGKKPQIPFVDVTAFKSATREVTVQQGKLL
jgi:adenine specific DNA methylase Mod